MANVKMTMHERGQRIISGGNSGKKSGCSIDFGDGVCKCKVPRAAKTRAAALAAFEEAKEAQLVVKEELLSGTKVTDTFQSTGERVAVEIAELWVEDVTTEKPKKPKKNRLEGESETAADGTVLNGQPVVN